MWQLIVAATALAFIMPALVKEWRDNIAMDKMGI